MNRADMIANERAQAAAYRREAKRRQSKNAALAARLVEWAEASERRAECIRSGPLFGGVEA